MSEKFIIPLEFAPGINRDKTLFESKQLNDGVNIRFYGGKVTKRGGFKEFYKGFDEITRSLVSLTQSGVENLPSNFVLAATEFTETKDGRVYILPVESASALTISFGPYIDISPVAPLNLGKEGLWQLGIMRIDTLGTFTSVLLALPTLTSNTLFSSAIFPLYQRALIGDGSNLTLEVINEDLIPSVSGGFLFLDPTLLLYGNEGIIYYSRNYKLDFSRPKANPEDPIVFRSLTVSPDKVCAIRPIIGEGSGQAALCWTMTQVFLLNYLADALVNETPDEYGSLLYKSFNVNTSLIAVNSIVSFNTMYFWIGNDGFYVYNGVVKKLENSTNLLWFLNNLDISQVNKIFAFTDSTFGEVTWVFPTRSGTRHAIVYNIEGDFWYDTPLERASALIDNRLAFPVLTDSLKRYNTQTARYYLEEVSTDGIYNFDTGEEVRVPIPFSFTSPPITLMLKELVNLTVNTLYPNFILPPNPKIEYTVKFNASHTPNGNVYSSKETIMNVDTDVINDIRIQGRIISITISCDELGSYLRMGLPLLECSLGDGRR